MGVTDLVTVMSTRGWTVVLVVLLVLLPRFGSPTSLECTVAELVRVRSVARVLPGLTTMVTTAVAPLARVGIAQSTVTSPLAGPAGLQVPVPVVTAALTRPFGLSRLASASRTCTLVAASGPALLTVST